ncbi:hypothetical protein ACFYTQ_24480 [Nocardia sp. NPDC004068]|uniref:hypothetical protein n=1 Tax=Nocardia sp. NPDC004068 TaxID=3364303 RepID=UPI0036D11F52
MLMLLQDPSGAAAGQSGFISMHNNDHTAHNVYEVHSRGLMRLPSRPTDYLRQR